MKHDPNIERLLAAFKHKRVDRVPNFEIVICERNVNYLLGEKLDRRTTQLDPKRYVQLAQRIGMDAISYRFSWDFGIPGPIRDWEDLERVIPHPNYDDFLSELRDVIRSTEGPTSECVFGRGLPSLRRTTSSASKTSW
ncbi:MAG: hypothetical protein ACUVXI_04175 [bacterium]